ncbi:hypothetical protein PoB_004864500 [Plakobranchus ocellatus]|uniref:Uncharacterized protein n=1 Tax=Plakobranchus ocellatus TaxID=259542 RepID=A0AAV4BSR5_9GAST|nr:hypothetical protein PoB_004864500 [Plakobranchus ocellatus]
MGRGKKEGDLRCEEVGEMGRGKKEGGLGKMRDKGRLGSSTWCPRWLLVDLRINVKVPQEFRIRTSGDEEKSKRDVEGWGGVGVSFNSFRSGIKTSSQN